MHRGHARLLFAPVPLQTLHLAATSRSFLLECCINESLLTTHFLFTSILIYSNDADRQLGTLLYPPPSRLFTAPLHGGVQASTREGTLEIFLKNTLMHFAFFITIFIDDHSANI